MSATLTALSDLPSLTNDKKVVAHIANLLVLMAGKREEVIAERIIECIETAIIDRDLREQHKAGKI